MMYWAERFRPAGVIALLVALAAAAPASGATFIDMEIPELVAASDAVVEGRVVDVVSFWDEKGVGGEVGGLHHPGAGVPDARPGRVGGALPQAARP
jgi:hypothetical protein